ncbi:MAG: hypothetical protein GY798_25550 [Hyphomicrobiales bacterium]|nr:hypothetical protein [Hyphomicrobiales bacterium]
MTSSIAVDRLASALQSARRDGTTVDTPSSLTDATSAYAIQDRMITLAGARPAGWKVGASAPGAAAALGLEKPFAGPLWAEDIKDAGTFTDSIDLLHPTALSVELEIAFRFGRTPSSDAADDIASAIDGIAPAFEFVGGRMDALPEPPGPAMIADHGRNVAVGIGEFTEEWSQLDLAACTGTLEIDGDPAGRGKGQSAMGDPFVSACWLVHHIQRRNYRIHPGQIILSGAIVICHDLPDRTEIRGSIAGIGSVECSMFRTAPAPKVDSAEPGKTDDV